MTKRTYFVSSDMSSIDHNTPLQVATFHFHSSQRHSVTTAALLLITKTSSMQATHAIKKQAQQLSYERACPHPSSLLVLSTFDEALFVFILTNYRLHSSDFSTFTHRDATVSQQSGWIATPLTQGNSCTTLHIAHYTCKIQLFPNGRTYLLEVGYFPRCPCLIQACR